jgi:hypothetical protein
MIFLFAGNRLANFQTGVTDVNPSSSAPRVGAYKVCNVMAGAVGRGASYTFKCPGCGVTGRYAIVQLRGRNYLTLCEVRVFGCKYMFAFVNLHLNNELSFI